jgi:hypothetical protein
MRKSIKKHAARISSLLKMIGMNSIRPFKEKPSVEREDPSQVAPIRDHPGATELFERFTADIIRERVTFIR